MLKDIVNSINKDFITEARNSPSLLSDMAAMERYMSESYSGRNIVELLQNADDAQSSRVFVTEQDGNVIFANNGRPFSEEDVLAISRSGASKKQRGKTIGYRGVGFKSASFLSSEIIIYSSNTAFCFSKSNTAKELGVNEEQVPTIRIPFLVDTTPYEKVIEDLKDKGFTTVFIFKSSDKNVLREEIEALSSDLMLFLGNLKEIETENFNDDKLLRVSRKTKEWGQEVTIDKKKLGIVDECIAFKIENDVFISCEADEALYYTFLPTYDKAPFPIKMNGGFSTDPSRKHIRLDDSTRQTLTDLSKAAIKVLNHALSNPHPIYKNILKIFAQSPSFSNLNIHFKRLFTIELENVPLLKLNCGKAIYLKDYVCFPSDFEGSVIHILRKQSEKIRKQSLSSEIYEYLDGVDEFLSNYSKQTYSLQDLVDVMAEEELVKMLPEYVYSYLLGKTVNAFNRGRLLSNNIVDITPILVKDENGEVLRISESEMDSNDLRDLLSKNEVNQSLTYSSLKSFVNGLNINYVEEEKSKSKFNNDVEEEEYNKDSEEEYTFQNLKPVFKASKPVIPKWRSAENACVEIEKFFGNNARDVSMQNLGYDIESITPKGDVKCIEVKSVSKSDMTFTMTNNEYTAAHQYGDSYFICLLVHGDNKSKAIYIQNPLSKLHFEKRIRQWEWFCDEYQGEEIDIEY